MTRITMRELAYHEAGHAVMAYRHRVKIQGRGIFIHPKVGGGACLPKIMPYGNVRDSLTNFTGDDLKRHLRRLFAQVEIFQAGEVAGRNSGGRSRGFVVPIRVICHEMSRQNGYQGLTNKHRTKCRTVDDLARSVWYLMEARRAITNRTPLLRTDLWNVLHSHRESELRVSEILSRERTWGAVEALAKALLKCKKLRQLRSEVVNDILDDLRPPRVREDAPLPPFTVGVLYGPHMDQQLRLTTRGAAWDALSLQAGTLGAP